ncbi:transcriptional regulator ATRX homolog isoform X2 [Ptychodera flava]|uniref:transcriptional regulator ATRX homolog isoform X2 n=1 Tax=Ptychodera flava TaxID=63121 RepID=UPI00396A9AFB
MVKLIRRKPVAGDGNSKNSSQSVVRRSLESEYSKSPVKKTRKSMPVKGQKATKFISGISPMKSPLPDAATSAPPPSEPSRAKTSRSVGQRSGRGTTKGKNIPATNRKQRVSGDSLHRPTPSASIRKYFQSSRQDEPEEDQAYHRSPATRKHKMNITDEREDEEEDESSDEADTATEPVAQNTSQKTAKQQMQMKRGIADSMLASPVETTRLASSGKRRKTSAAGENRAKRPHLQDRRETTSDENDSNEDEETVDNRTERRSMDRRSWQSVRSTPGSNVENPSQRRESESSDSNVNQSHLQRRESVASVSSASPKDVRKKAACTKMSIVESHMADKEFIMKQAALLKQPFTLNPESLQLLQVLREQARADSNGESDGSRSLPMSILNNAVRKLNHRLSDKVQVHLSRTKLRNVVLKLGEHRKNLDRSSKNKSAVGDTRTGASLQEILESYPMEWPVHYDVSMDDDITDRMQEKIERYSQKRAQVFALNRSVIESKRELQQLKTLLDLAQSAKELADSCDCDELNQELQRTNHLLVQVYAKLLKTGPSRRTSRNSVEANHSALN